MACIALELSIAAHGVVAAIDRTLLGPGAGKYDGLPQPLTVLADRGRRVDQSYGSGHTSCDRGLGAGPTGVALVDCNLQRAPLIGTVHQNVMHVAERTHRDG